MAGQRRYLHFCKAAGIKPLPASEGALTLFTTHLAVSNVSHGTIKVYLSAVRHLHICKGLHGHFSQQLTPRLHLILRGIKKRQADVHSRRKRLPITTQLLGKIKHLLSKQPTYDNTTLWAMCCLAFFGFLRVSEFTIPSKGSYNSSRHLSLQDVTVDNRTNPAYFNCFSSSQRRTHSNKVHKSTSVPPTQLFVQLKQCYLTWQDETVTQALFSSPRKEKAGQILCSAQLSKALWGN